MEFQFVEVPKGLTVCLNGDSECVLNGRPSKARHHERLGQLIGHELTVVEIADHPKLRRPIIRFALPEALQGRLNPGDLQVMAQHVMSADKIKPTEQHLTDAETFLGEFLLLHCNGGSGKKKQSGGSGKVRRRS